MSKICILVPLLLLIPGGASNLRTASFKHYSDMKSWSGVQAYCRSQHTDLVTIGDEIENQDFVDGRGWIGLYRKDSTSEWKWSRRDEIANFTTWEENPAADANCAFKYSGYKKWHGHPCGTSHSFMCFDEKLILVKKRRTWEQALRYCRALEAVDSTKPATAYQNHRYDLAPLLTSDDHVYAREKARWATTNEVWTGLRYLAGQWVWVSGAGAVQYSDVESCPTKRLCGFLVKNGTAHFNTGDCKWRRNFLCYRKP